MVCRFNPFYIGPNPPAAVRKRIACATVRHVRRIQDIRSRDMFTRSATREWRKRETKESKCNPPCIEAPKEEKSERKHKKEKKEKKDKGEHKDKKEHKHKKENKDKKETQDKKEK